MTEPDLIVHHFHFEGPAVATEPTPAPAATPAPIPPTAGILINGKPLKLNLLWVAVIGLAGMVAHDKYEAHRAAAAPEAPDLMATVKATAIAYRKDEAAAFRRVKATVVRTGDMAKDKAALATAIHDQRIAKAQALADSLTASADWPAALEAAAAAFDATEKK